jgi:hypothetical protein
MSKSKDYIVKIPNEFRMKNIPTFMEKTAELGKDDKLSNWTGKEVYFMLFYLYLFEKSLN